MSSKKLPFYYVLPIILLSSLLVAGIINAVWNEPSDSPPGNNVPAPINVSPNYQIKGNPTGSASSLLHLYNPSADNILTLQRGGGLNPTHFKLGIDNALVINNSGQDTLTLKSGNVGIRMTSPNYTLDVAGDINIGPTNVYRRGGVAGVSRNCSAGQTPSGITISGGIVTSAGACTSISGGALQNLFETINVPSGTDPVADSPNDVLNLQAGPGISISGNASTDTITFTNTGDTNPGDDITNITDTFPVVVTGSGNSRNIALTTTCGTNQILKWTGTSWTCANDETGTGLGGSGTTGYIPRWTGSTSLGNSVIFQSGSNLGIGTTAPNYPLTIDRDWPQISFRGGGDRWTIGSGTSAFAIQNATDNAIRLWIDNNTGNVGIGTTRPQAKLHVIGDGVIIEGSYGNLMLKSTGSGQRWTIQSHSSSGNLIFRQTTSDSFFGNVRMYLEDDGTGLYVEGSRVCTEANGACDGRYLSVGETYTFGGMYRRKVSDGSCFKVNAITGTCSCPAGYNNAFFGIEDAMATEFSPPESVYTYYCY